MPGLVINQRTGLAIYALILAFLACLSAYFLLPRIEIPPVEMEAEGIRVIDGDTFAFANGTSVRLICIDSPEKGEEGYEEAGEYLNSLLMKHTLRFERDVSEQDSYGRLLRYVYADEVFVNREMVRSGHARVFRYGNDTKRCDEIAQ